MVIPSTGQITLTMIQTEFGGTNPISLNEYYAGGAYVPAGTSGTNGAVPSSGAISLSNFYGTSGVAYNLISTTYEDVALGPDDASVEFVVYSTGLVVVNLANDVGPEYFWITPQTTASTHYLRVTPTSGTFSTNSGLNAWVSLSVGFRAYKVVFTGFSGSKSATATYEISPNSNGSPIVASATITLTAVVEL